MEGNDDDKFGEKGRGECERKKENERRKERKKRIVELQPRDDQKFKRFLVRPRMLFVTRCTAFFFEGGKGLFSFVHLLWKGEIKNKSKRNRSKEKVFSIFRSKPWR